MFIVQHLQQQRTELQEEYELLSNTLRKLRDAHVFETDPAQKLKLEHQIQQCEESREKIVPKIEELDAKINALDQTTKLYNALLRLNFRNQVALFRKLLSKSQVGAFLIYGEPDYGQRWLLNRLINQVPKNTASKIIPINLMSIARRWGLDALHREFRRQQGLAGTLSLGDVVDQVHGWWQTQTVILIFHNLNTLDEMQMREFIQSFWMPLVDKALNVPCPSPYYKLLVFLIDNDGYIDAWPFEVAEQIDASWKPHIPVKPPKLAPILNDELITWMTYEGERLPFKLQVEDILKRNNDLLLELDEKRFMIEETEQEIRAEVAPIVFITSNEEKDLPDAFLRRCLFHYIEFPDRARLIEIVNAHISDLPEALVNAAIDRFIKLREEMNEKGAAGKKVSTSELIDWLRVLHRYPQDEVMQMLKGRLPYAGVLLKNWDDHQRYILQTASRTE